MIDLTLGAPWATIQFEEAVEHFFELLHSRRTCPLQVYFLDWPRPEGPLTRPLELTHAWA